MANASPIIMMLLMFGVFWLILIRPQVKRQKEHAAMLNKLEKGEMIITRGGLIGKISGVTDRVLTIELQEKVRVRVLRTHVEGKYDPATSGASRDQQSKKKAA